MLFQVKMTLEKKMKAKEEAEARLKAQEEAREKAEREERDRGIGWGFAEDAVEEGEEGGEGGDPDMSQVGVPDLVSKLWQC